MSDRRPADRSDEPVTVDSLSSDLRNLGLAAGETVLVHSSLSSLGWVCGGPPAVVDALMGVLGESGTLVMPTHSPGNRDPTNMGAPPIPDDWDETVRDQMPAYREAVTPTQGVGAIPECFRSYPAVHRSAHPQHSFAAWGADAAFVTDDHAYDYSLGERSPLARVYDRDGRVLLLGTTHAANTSLHLAEYRAAIDIESELRASAVLVDSTRAWIEWEDLAVDDSDFPACGASFQRHYPEAVETGSVGVADATLLDQRPLVDFTVEWFETARS